MKMIFQPWKFETFIFSLLVLMFFSTSCQTYKTQDPITENSSFGRRNASDGAPLDDDYSWIDNLDFKTSDEKKFNPENDQYKNIPDKKNSPNEADKPSGEIELARTQHMSVLARESLGKFSSSKLLEISQGADNPLDKIASLCYQDAFENAFKLIDQIYFQYKNNTSYWNQVGSCYFLKKEVSKAILFFNKSRDLNGKYAPPMNNLGVIYLSQGKNQKAMLAFKKASDLNTFALTPLFNLSLLMLRFGNVDSSLAILEALYKKENRDSDLLSALGVAYLLKNAPEKSLEYFKKIDRQIIIQPQVGINYALALKMSKKDDEAKSVLSLVQIPKDADHKNYYEKVKRVVETL